MCIEERVRMIFEGSVSVPFANLKENRDDFFCNSGVVAQDQRGKR